MKFRIFSVLMLVATIVAPAFAADTVPMNPGKWEYSMQIDIPNMPFKVPPFKFTTCVTKEQLEKDPQSALPKDNKKNSDCKQTDMKIDGNRVTWTVECPKSKTTGQGDITYAEESFTGTMKMNMDGTESTTKYSGKRLGACDK